ncbi:hypothetical protein GGS24DRAFT_495023 [Hypoxylon argillaceum]|nr:hypothetical protein GGS24DRAFT_495023 [Hypoxylon argillaceum]
MAEAIATLNLASSILQVIDFASGFTTTAWKLYQADNRSWQGPDDIIELRNITTNLAGILRDLQPQSNVSGAAVHSDSESMISLAKECAVVVEELLQTLPIETNATRKRDAIRMAFKLKWKSEDIRALSTRLTVSRSQLTLNLLVSMRQYASQSVVQQELILKDLSALSGKSSNLSIVSDDSYSEERMGSSVLEYVTSKLSPTTRLEEKRRLQSYISQAIRRNIEDDASNGHPSLSLSMSGVARTDSSDTLLASLTYTRMDDREWRVAKAHCATFRWLFDENEEARKSDFKDWLSSEEKLYWIAGKAASGKSTLMKNISHPEEPPDHPNPRARCYKDLSKWSGDSRGMMMTLLHQILKQCPDLAPVISPARWEMLCLELRNALRHAIRNAQNYDTKIALFIDGLDEFEGKSEELIELLQDILPLPNLKLCDAFRHKPSLRLEDLNYDDIKKFVASKFDAEPLFQDLRDQEEQYADALITSIVSKAQGVFLWVALVVSSLIAGLSSGDRLSDLEKRLALLPPGLEGLYDRIIRSMDTFYLEHAAQLFALVAASQQPLNVGIALFADEEAPDAEIQRCIDTMTRRINTRTKGLLEVKQASDASYPRGISVNYHTIQYFHRTMIFRPALTSSFDPYLRLLAGQVTVAAANSSKMVILLDELDKVVSTLWKRIAINTEEAGSRREENLWTLQISPVLDRTTFGGHFFGYTFLSLAVACNVVEYVRAKAPPSCLVEGPYLNIENPATTSKQWPLIMDIISTGLPFVFRILRAGVYYESTIEDQSESSIIPMLECLLAKGADPAYSAYVGHSNTSLLVEMIANMMRNQAGSVPEAIRLLIAGVKIDEVMLAQILHRFRERAFGGMMIKDYYNPSGSLPSPPRTNFKRYLPRRERIYPRSFKKTTRHLRITLENLRDANKSADLIDYAQVINMAPEFSVAQGLISSHLTLLLTLGAKKQDYIRESVDCPDFY